MQRTIDPCGPQELLPALDRLVDFPLTPGKLSASYFSHPIASAQSTPCAQHWCRSPGTPCEHASIRNWVRTGSHALLMDRVRGPCPTTVSCQSDSPGTRNDAGRTRSTGNPPEPAVVLVVTPASRIAGPTTGNQVTLRDGVVILPRLTYSPGVMPDFGFLFNLKLLNRRDHSPGVLASLPAPLLVSRPWRD
jgi:hypothetical protein